MSKKVTSTVMFIGVSLSWLWCCGSRPDGAAVSRWPCQHDADHHRGHFARDGDADEIRHVHLCPERLPLHGADVGEGQPDEGADERDDRQRLRADALHEEEQIAAPNASGAGEETAQADADRADERERVARGSRGRDRAGADTTQQERPIALASGTLVLGDGAGQRQQPARALRPTGEVNGHGCRGTARGQPSDLQTTHLVCPRVRDLWSGRISTRPEIETGVRIKSGDRVVRLRAFDALAAPARVARRQFRQEPSTRRRL